MSATAESLAMFGIVWLLHAVAASWPAIVAWIVKLPGRWRSLSAALVIIPFLALIGAQGIWPVGGAASFMWRLGLLTIVVLGTQALLLLPSLRRGPKWSRLLLLLVAVVAVVPIQLIVPSLPD
jgi:hypothetical protein